MHITQRCAIILPAYLITLPAGLQGPGPGPGPKIGAGSGPGPGPMGPSQFGTRARGPQAQPEGFINWTEGLLSNFDYIYLFMGQNCLFLREIWQPPTPPDLRRGGPGWRAQLSPPQMWAVVGCTTPAPPAEGKHIAN